MQVEGIEGRRLEGIGTFHLQVWFSSARRTIRGVRLQFAFPAKRRVFESLQGKPIRKGAICQGCLERSDELLLSAITQPVLVGMRGL